MSRSLAGVLALWLAVCLAEPVQLHTCAMHGGGAEESAQAAPQESSSTGTHNAPQTLAGHSHHEQNSDTGPRQCTCFGDCNAGSSQVGFAAAGVSLVKVAIIESAASEVAYASPSVVAPRFLLPFSNGPPADSSRA